MIHGKVLNGELGRTVAARRAEILVNPGTQFLQGVIQLVAGGAGAAATSRPARAWPIAPMELLPVFPTVQRACQPLSCRLSTQNVVELLLVPTCFGKARQVVLKHFGSRYGSRFANHWDFVRFAKEQHLDLDFTTPPKRPARP